MSGDSERAALEGLSEHPLRLIAAVMQVSVSTVSRRLRAMGLGRARGGARPHPFEEKRREEIAAVLRAHPSLTQSYVASLFGVSRKTVNLVAKHLKEEGREKERK